MTKKKRSRNKLFMRIIGNTLSWTGLIILFAPNLTSELALAFIAIVSGVILYETGNDQK